jgi:TolA-binding protein
VVVTLRRNQPADVPSCRLPCTALVPLLCLTHTLLYAQVAALERMEAEEHELSSHSRELEAELASNHVKQRAMGLMEQIKLLQEKKHELEAEEHKLHMSPEEQREQLKAAIRQVQTKPYQNTSAEPIALGRRVCAARGAGGVARDR